MDHLAPKSNVLYTSSPVPLAHDPAGTAKLSVDCDSGNFSRFPTQVGWYFDAFDPTVPSSRGIWKRAVPLPLPGCPSSGSELAQAWLFFGMLSVFFKTCDVEFKASDFVRILDDGSKWVSTISLSGYLEQWTSQARGLSEDRFLELQQVFHTIFTTVLDAIDALPVHCDKFIFYSICVLAETLENTARCALPILAQKPLIFKGKSFHIDLGQNPYRPYRCESEEAMVGWAFNASTRIYLLRSLPPRDSSLDHSRCSYNHCLARQIDDAVYQTKHATEGCTCEHVQLDLDPIKACLERNQIPCLRVVEDGDDVRVTVAHGQLFTAVSHVWSDGLGNAHANSLPRCQLLRLQSLSDALFEHEGERIPAYFWIDTLCVPLEKKYRKLALRQLGDVYGMADWVLVLDSGIMETRRDWPVEDKLLGICFSGWLRRLWTLQEGLLCGKRLRFQLQDGIFCLPQSGECLYSTVQANTLQFIRQRVPPLNDMTEDTSHNLSTESALSPSSPDDDVSQRPPLSSQRTSRDGILTTPQTLAVQLEDAVSSLFRLLKYLCRSGRDRVFRFIRQYLLPFRNTVDDHINTDFEDANAPCSPPAATPPATKTRRRSYPQLRTDLVSLFPALLYRSTSKKTDETICLSSMLGVQPADLVPFEAAEERMQQFWNILASQASGRYAVPADVLFTLEPKLEADGYRWAPKSLMELITTDLASFGVQASPVDGVFTGVQDRAYFDGHGLRTSCRGYRIRRVSRKLSETDTLWFRSSGIGPDHGFYVSPRVVSGEDKEQDRMYKLGAAGTRGDDERLFNSLTGGEDDTCIVFSSLESRNGPDVTRAGTFVQLVREGREGEGSNWNVYDPKIIVARAMEQALLYDISVKKYTERGWGVELEVDPISEDDEWYIL